MSDKYDELLFEAVTDIEEDLIEKAYKVNIEANYRKRSLRKKWILILAATLILGALSVVAAEYSGGGVSLTSYLDLDKSGEAIVGDMKSNINKTVTEDDIEISILNSIADSNNLYLMLSVTFPEGTDMSKGFEFYTIDLFYPRGFVNEYIGDMISPIILEDDNTGDNTVYYFISFTGADTIPKEKLHLRLRQIIYQESKGNIEVGDKIIVSKVGFKDSFKVMKSRAMIESYSDSSAYVIEGDGEWDFHFNLNHLDHTRAYSSNIYINTPYNNYNISEIIINPLSLLIKGISSDYKYNFEEGRIIEAVILKDGTRIELEGGSQSHTIYDDMIFSNSFNKIIDPKAVDAIVIAGEEYPVDNLILKSSGNKNKDLVDINVLISLMTILYLALYSLLSFRSYSIDFTGALALIISFKGNRWNSILRDRKAQDIERYKLKAFKKNKDFHIKNFNKERKRRLRVLIIARIFIIAALSFIMVISIRTLWDGQATTLGLIYMSLVVIDLIMIIKLLILDFEAKNV